MKKAREFFSSLMEKELGTPMCEERGKYLIHTQFSWIVGSKGHVVCSNTKEYISFNLNYGGHKICIHVLEWESAHSSRGI